MPFGDFSKGIRILNVISLCCLYHTVTLNLTDSVNYQWSGGSEEEIVQLKFVIEPRETESANSETTTTEDVSVATTSAETEGNSQVVLWLVLLIVSGIGAAGIAVYSTKRRRNR